jgi:hypothetical protein
MKKYTYWVGPDQAPSWQERLEGAGLDVFAVRKAPCIPLSARYEIGMVSPEAFTDYSFCSTQLSYYKYSPVAGMHLIISSVDLSDFGLAPETVISPRPDFFPPRQAGPQECTDLIAEPKYKTGQPREWAVLDTEQATQKQRWQKMTQLTGLKPEELWPYHQANHANFMEPRLFVIENGQPVPYSIATTSRICSACLEFFNIVGRSFTRKLVVPCPGAVMFARLTADLYYQVDSLLE